MGAWAGVLRDGRAWAACLAISLWLVSTWLLNVTAYPSFNDVFPLARDVATVFGALLSLVLARLALDHPRALTGHALLVAVLVTCVLATAGMFLGSQLGSPVLITAFSCLRCLAGSALSVYLVFTLMTLSAQESLAVLVGAYLLKYFWMALLSLCPYTVRCVALGVTQVMPLAVLAWLAWPALARISAGPAARELMATNPLSFLPLTHWLFVAILLFEAAMGFAITYGSQASYPRPTILAFGAFALVTLAVLVRGRTSLDALYALAFGLVLAGILLIPSLSAARVSGALPMLVLAGSLSNALLDAGSGVIGIAVWLLAGSLGRRNEAGALAVALTISAARGFGTELGAASGHLQNHLEATSPELAALFVAALALGFALYNFVLARRFSFDAAVAEVQPAEPVAEVGEGDARLAGIDRRCEELSRNHGLTAREAEVLALLARGRNAAYIQERLTISRNTVKSYVARVYGKLGVHSHQEVIDLVDAPAGDS